MRRHPTSLSLTPALTLTSFAGVTVAIVVVLYAYISLRRDLGVSSAQGWADISQALAFNANPNPDPYPDPNPDPYPDPNPDPNPNLFRPRPTPSVQSVRGTSTVSAAFLPSAA